MLYIILLVVAFFHAFLNAPTILQMVTLRNSITGSTITSRVDDTGTFTGSEGYNRTATMLEAVARMERLEARRGVRYLYERHNLLLVLEPVVVFSHGFTIRIVDLVDPSVSKNKCQDLNLTIWVRLAGPEIISGIATQSIQGDCTWIYSHHQPLTLSGRYEVVAKVLTLNDGVDANMDECNLQNHAIYKGNIVQNYTPPGTFYAPESTCCEICSRHEECLYFALEMPTGMPTRCILYSSVTRVDFVNETKDSSSPVYIAGTSRSKVQPGPIIHLGCGYGATQEMNFCLDEGRDDIPYIVQPKVEVEIRDIQTKENVKNNKSGMKSKICPRTLKGVGHGRWVKSNWFQNCTMEMAETDVKFPQYLHRNDEPEECWIYDRLIGNGCHNGCNRNPEGNLWRSSLMEEHDDRFFPYMWKPYDCDLVLYSDEMLTKCFLSHGYARPSVVGDSVAEFFEEYVNMRFDSLDSAIYGDKPVIIDNLWIMHAIWHNSNTEWNSAIQSRVGLLQDGAVGIWLNGPFLSSEREVHCTQGRMGVFVDSARPHLKARGWTEVDWRNISMAVSYESATQYDGLHVVGSSMKVAFHLAMHGLCADDDHQGDKSY